MAVLRHPIDLVGKLRAAQLHSLELALVAVSELILEHPRLLIEPRLGDSRRALGRLLELVDFPLQIILVLPFARLLRIVAGSLFGRVGLWLILL